ncbi:MAG: Ger(x)C family spore germination protein [Bacillota bacterium]
MRGSPPRLLSLLLLLLALALPMAGCWDNREPQRRAYVLGMGIDPDPEDEDQIVLSLQMPIPRAAARGKEGAGAGEEQYFLVQGRGASMVTALQDAQDHVSRALFLGQMRAIVLSADLSARQVEHVTIGLRTNPDIEDTVYMTVTQGRADQVLLKDARLERLPALFFNSVFEAVRRMTVSEPVQLWQYWRAQLTSGWEPVLPRVEAAGDEVEVQGLAAYRGYELMGFLEGEEAQGYLWLMGSTVNRALFVETEGGPSSVRSLAVTARPRVRFEGNRPVYSVELHIVGEVALPIHHPGGTQAEMEMIREAAEERILQQVERAITRIQQELRTDIFGFGKLLFYRHPRYFASVDWEELFPQVRIEPAVTVSLHRKGAMH